MVIPKLKPEWLCSRSDVGWSLASHSGVGIPFRRSRL